MTSMTGNFTHNSRRPCLGNQKAQRARPPPRPARPVGTGEEGALARARAGLYVQSVFALVQGKNALYVQIDRRTSALLAAARAGGGRAAAQGPRSDQTKVRTKVRVTRALLPPGSRSRFTPPSRSTPEPLYAGAASLGDHRVGVVRVAARAAWR